MPIALPRNYINKLELQVTNLKTVESSFQARAASKVSREEENCQEVLWPRTTCLTLPRYVKEKYLSEFQKFRSKDWTRGKNRVVTLDKLIKFANEVKAFHEFLPHDVEKDIIGIVSDLMLPSMPFKFQEDMFSDLMEIPDEK